MKGVIASIAPHAMVDDASHEIEPGDVAGAAFTLARYARRYPPGTVHVIVVDPGVGTARRPLAGLIGERFYVAPDNGVLTRVLADAPGAQIVEIAPAALQRSEVSATFHGRDIFAPAAAVLAAGTKLEQLGAPVDDPLMLAIPRPSRDGSTVRGEVVYIDRFGNLITNIPGAWVSGNARVSVGITDVGSLHRTYGDVESGHALALIGSDELLEIAVRDGSAAERLRAGRETTVQVMGNVEDRVVLTNL